jgi:hypothetical protein
VTEAVSVTTDTLVVEELPTVVLALSSESFTSMFVWGIFTITRLILQEEH